jgi:uncharacterized membrane protein YdjX (TVP38/TMEM64 family)
MRRGHPLLRLAVLALLVGAAFAAIALTGPLNAARVRGLVGGGAPVWQMLAFVVVSSLLTVGLFPGPLLAATAGVLFGVAEGTIVSIVSATLGGVLAFLLANVVAGDALERIGGRRTQAIAAWIGNRGFLAVLYARIMPGVPYTLVNYAAGLSPVALGSFALATLIGCAPRAFAYAALGSSFSVGNLTSPAAIAAVAVLVVMGLAGLILARRTRTASELLDL